MIYETLQTRRFVRRYDNTVDISESLIDSLLRKTWEVTPSKNNFMPYSVHVIGQGSENQKYKDLTYSNCLAQEAKADNVDINTIMAERYNRHPDHFPSYYNIVSCSYLLIFTTRVETILSPYQQAAVNSGRNFEALDESRLKNSSSFEMGLFVNAFSGMCLENQLNVSLIGCLPSNLSKWKDFPFLTNQPIMLMTVGKAKSVLPQVRPDDLRPNYDRIVNFIR
jgi:hypothetical protein